MSRLNQNRTRVLDREIKLLPNKHLSVSAIDHFGGMAAFAETISLDNFSLGKGYYVWFCFFHLGGIDPMCCRNRGSGLYCRMHAQYEET